MPTIVQNLIEGLESRDQQFYAAMRLEDDLGIVVRGQIHVEHELQQLILAVAPRPKEVKFEELDFDSTLRLALVLGLSRDISGAISSIGKLRNKFAHRLGFKVSQQDADSIYNAMGPSAKDPLQKVWREVRSDGNEKELPKKFQQLPVIEQIKFLMIAARSAILASRLRLEGKV